jgi:hypothetical protein
MNCNNNKMQDETVSNIHNTTNKRIYDRNIPSQMLQQYIDVRPVMTKYSYLPIVDPRKEIGVKMNQSPTFNPHTTFNPGNSQSPWSGFASNINKESELRNQIYALQKSSQAVYVPSSNSDLYTYSFNPNQTNPNQRHGLLFKNETFDSFNPNPNPNIIGTNMFSNSTRSQLKDLNPNDSK